MKKIISILLAAVMVMALLAGCGSKNSDKTNDNNTPNNNQTTELSGSVSTNGSTSMDKVIGALREQFMADHKNVTVTYDPTGSGSGIEAVKNGTADIGLASRGLKDEEKADGLTETVIALDGIAVIVNAQSKVTDLTVEQIAQIAKGEITVEQGKAINSEVLKQAQATADDAEQTELYKQMERNLTEHAANVYIQDLADLVVLRNGLEGYQFYPIYVMDLSTVHYAQ